jgi:hypothetical protein
MGTVPASAVWIIAAKTSGESLWNLVENQRFRVEKAVFFFSGIAHPSHMVYKLLKHQSFNANLLKPASFSSRTRFITATWANSANGNGLWFLPYFRSLLYRFPHSCNWRGFCVDL